MRIRDIWHIVEGLFWCSFKGIKLALLRLPKSKRPKLANSWGFHDPRLHGWVWTPELGKHYRTREDTWLEQETLPRGGKSHHRTDLIVEWCNLSAQRGAKLLCALYPAFLLIGFGLGWIAATHL